VSTGSRAAFSMHRRDAPHRSTTFLQCQRTRSLREVRRRCSRSRHLAARSRRPIAPISIDDAMARRDNLTAPTSGCCHASPTSRNRCDRASPRSIAIPILACRCAAIAQSRISPRLLVRDSNTEFDDDCLATTRGYGRCDRRERGWAHEEIIMDASDLVGRAPRPRLHMRPAHRYARASIQEY
jgi:hypothetical protein